MQKRLAFIHGHARQRQLVQEERRLPSRVLDFKNALRADRLLAQSAHCSRCNDCGEVVNLNMTA
jgi:hypothetical protein